MTFIKQGAKFSENFSYTLKHNEPAPRIKIPARKQITTQAI